MIGKLLLPAIPSYPLLLVAFPVPERVHVPAGHAVGARQPQGRAADEPSGREAGAQRLAAAQGREEVDAAPGARQAGAVGREAGQVDVAGEEEDRGEGEGEGLEWAGVQGRY